MRSGIDQIRLKLPFLNSFKMNFPSFLLVASVAVMVSITSAIPTPSKTFPAVAFSETMADPYDGSLAKELDKSDIEEANSTEAVENNSAELSKIDDDEMRINSALRVNVCTVNVPVIGGLSFRHAVCSKWCQVHGHRGGECAGTDCQCN